MPRPPGDIDLYGHDKKLKAALDFVATTPISERNRALILEFDNDCASGWGGRQLSVPRRLKAVRCLRVIAESVVGQEFDGLTEKGVKRLLQALDRAHPGQSAQHDYRLFLRKFMAWLRAEHGYPRGYPERAEHARVLPLIKYPLEVNKIRLPRVEGGPSAEEIPEGWEVDAIMEATVNPRDRAYLAVSKELGPRIGGIGTRRIKHISFDELGARIAMSDKTMDGEPVRLIESASSLRLWLEVHHYRDDPEAPLWLDTKKGRAPLRYAGFRELINRAVKRHNRRHPGRQITKKLRTHLFRYYAQVRDETEGVPRAVQCKQRGWKAGSKSPDRYARLTSRNVDEFLARKHGLVKAQDDGQKVRRCPRCQELNAPRVRYCARCGLPLDPRAAEEYEIVRKELRGILYEEERERLKKEILKELGKE